MEALKQVEPKRVMIGEIRGKGLMVGMELVENQETREPASAKAAGIRAAMREKGILIGVGGAFANVLRIQPPLTISDDELNRVVHVLKDVI